MIVDNIIVGGLVEGLTEDQIGIHKDETTIRLTLEQARNDNDELFLPNILKIAEICKSTSDVRRINDQRQQNDKFKKDPDQNLWRTLTQPEMTQFKIGKKVFWLVVGEINI